MRHLSVSDMGEMRPSFDAPGCDPQVPRAGWTRRCSSVPYIHRLSSDRALFVLGPGSVAAGIDGFGGGSAALALSFLPSARGHRLHLVAGKHVRLLLLRVRVVLRVL
eukprot:CAMPEP_0180026596 /NCGR_PEP_ID=MMETSP0984-20121128/25271_1 /TAXON_ID=483367 /ORGANISM="non described non described, Strain CCMP 2436" /LENGTH=106 /DNA_ID=CAMNT_0021951301 /DNA_START=63 /DNA_END=379 /DNA_ORIENTATION=-